MAPRRPARNHVSLFKLQLHFGFRTEVTLHKCHLGFRTKGMETFKPCVGLLFAYFIVRVDRSRPRPVAKRVWEPDDGLLSAVGGGLDNRHGFGLCG